MESYIREFVGYLQEVKQKSKNTQLSYARDLKKLNMYCAARGIESVALITEEILGEYLEHLQQDGMKPATISRNIASVKAFFYIF